MKISNFKYKTQVIDAWFYGFDQQEVITKSMMLVESSWKSFLMKYLNVQKSLDLFLWLPSFSIISYDFYWGEPHSWGSLPFHTKNPHRFTSSDGLRAPTDFSLSLDRLRGEGKAQSHGAKKAHHFRPWTEIFVSSYVTVMLGNYIGVSKNRGTPKWMVYKRKPY